MPAENKSEDKNDKPQAPNRMLGVWMAAIGGVVVLLAVFAIGIHTGRFNDERFGIHDDVRTGGFALAHHRGGMPMMNQGAGSRGNGQDRVTGTVTAINGQNFTVGGHGSSHQVQTNGSTQYQNGNTVKVNDTVIALGTTNNGALTATQVVINP